MLGRPTERLELDAAERPRTIDELRKLTHEQRVGCRNSVALSKRAVCRTIVFCAPHGPQYRSIIAKLAGRTGDKDGAAP